MLCTTTKTITLAPSQIGNSIDLGNDTLVENGTNVMSTPGPGFTTYVWSTGDSCKVIIIDTSGYYSVTVTDSTGCSETDDIEVWFCEFQDIAIRDG